MTDSASDHREEEEDDGGMAVALGIKVLQSIIFVYDFITFPIYYVIQQPWTATEAMDSVRATVIERTKTSVTYKPIDKTLPELELFKSECIETMYDTFDFAVKMHSHRSMVGTRQVLSEEDEIQPNGKVFKKWEMGEYSWQSYLEIEELATSFGKGLRVLGLEPLERICIFAETKADWMVCAIACFKQTFPLVTLYANLGDDAIVHGVNETEVTHLITSHELMPKFRNVLHRTPSVKHVIFLEDQINTTDKSGYKDGVQLHGFREVIELGRKSMKNFSVRRPTPDDPAIIMYTSGSTGVPKGVVLPHEALVTTIKAFHYVANPIQPGESSDGFK
jgi:long-chain acyl-CoA synthetase